MERLCSCGKNIAVQLCTIVFQNRLNIENVPVYSCGHCGNSEVYSGVKSDLKGLIEKFEAAPGKQQIQFEEVSEIAHFYLQTLAKPLECRSVHERIEERVNELLDTYILAKSLQDVEWTDDIHRRLLQLNELSEKADSAVR